MSCHNISILIPFTRCYGEGSRPPSLDCYSTKSTCCRDHHLTCARCLTCLQRYVDEISFLCAVCHIVLAHRGRRSLRRDEESSRQHLAPQYGSFVWFAPRTTFWPGLPAVTLLWRILSLPVSVFCVCVSDSCHALHSTLPTAAVCTVTASTTSAANPITGRLGTQQAGAGDPGPSRRGLACPLARTGDRIALASILGCVSHDGQKVVGPKTSPPH